MGEIVAPLVDEVFPDQPARQWVMSRVLGIVHRSIATHLIKQAGLTRKRAQNVTLLDSVDLHCHIIKSGNARSLSNEST